MQNEHQTDPFAPIPPGTSQTIINPNTTANLLQAQLLQQRQDASQLQQDDEYDSTADLFTVQSANHWLMEANARPIPRMLFGKLWYEGELCILFADSNVGKSILAVQIGDCISSGKGMPPFTIEAQTQAVLYCDFELTDKQFEARYSHEYAEHYTFADSYYRSQLNPDNQLPDGFDDFDQYIIYQLERAIVQNNVRVVIIDNLTYLRNEAEQAKDALPLMKQLKALKNRYGLSILALAHTPKRDSSLPIGKNDLQGSKMLMNFCDSAFAIGESQADKNLRYIKQIKQRNTEQVYGADNVCLCHIIKPHNFLQYEFIGIGNEWEHLRKAKEDDNERLMNAATTLKQQGFSLRESARALGISYQKVDRLLKLAEKQ